jgi:hypothetical protein
MIVAASLMFAFTLLAGGSQHSEDPGVDVEQGDLFGWSIAELGDVDGDGARDLAIGCPSSHYDNGVARVWLFSGRTGAVVGELGASDTIDGVGGWLANAGDVDGDGSEDVFFYAGERCAELWSVKRGRLLQVPAPAWPRALLVSRPRESSDGAAILGSLGDVDGDGRRDLLVATRIHSGCDGRVLRDFGSLAGLEHGVESARVAPDLDGDGCDDVVFVTHEADATLLVIVSALGGGELRRERLRSDPFWRYVPRAGGADEAVLKTEPWRCVRVFSAREAKGHGSIVVAGEDFHSLALRIARLGSSGDVLVARGGDMDGHHEVLWLGDSDDGRALDVISARDSGAWIRRSRVESLATIWSACSDDFRGHASWGRISALCSVADLDSDGRQDFALGVNQPESPGLPGYVHIRSGADGTLLRKLDTRDALLQVHARR